MRRLWAWTFGGAGVLLGAAAATLLTPVGAALWHYNAAFAVSLAAAAAAWPLLQHRRVATLSMAASGVLATVSGFVMLYTIDFPHKDWITWWHSVTSFWLVLAFLVHWLHNRQRLGDFTRRLLGRDRAPGVAAMGAWLGVLAAGAWTWGAPAARAAFTRESYLPLASWAVLGAVAFAYGAWLAGRAPAARAALARTASRNRARALVDTALFLSHWGALLTGFALLYFADFLRGGDLKYVSKWWHTATSVAFLAFVALHVGFNARPLAAHARRVDADLRR